MLLSVLIRSFDFGLTNTIKVTLNYIQIRGLFETRLDLFGTVSELIYNRFNLELYID